MSGIDPLPLPEEDPRRLLLAAPASLRINALANYLGRAWAILIGVGCLPLFLNVLGAEAYGLIGAFAVLQGWALLLDFGLAPTLNREIARTSGGERSLRSLADLIRSFEILAVVIVVVVAVLVFLAASFLATRWLRPEQLPVDTVVLSIRLMGVLAAMRWLEQVYRGAIQGREDQVWLNKVQTVTETLRWVGAYLFISFVVPTIIGFFVWNLGVSILSASLLRYRTLAALPHRREYRARFSLAELRGVRGFAFGMFASALLTFLLTQTDKVVVGKFLPLSQFGIYMMASTVAAALLQLIQPMNAAVLPRLVVLVAQKDRPRITATFMTSAQWLAVVVVPVALLIAFMPEQLLLAWTNNPSIARSGAPVLALLVLASLFNGFMNIPYMLQLANGWTSLSIKVNLVAVAFLVPLTIFATRWFGGPGAAAMLVLVNCTYILVVPGFVFTRLLPGEQRRWMIQAVLTPLVAGAVAGLVVRLLLPVPESRIGAMVALALGGSAIGLAVVLATDASRRFALRLFDRVSAWRPGSNLRP